MLEEHLALLRDLVHTPRVSGNEKAAADLLERFMLSRGLRPQRVENNLWVESEPASERPCVMLNAHIDTVKVAPGWTADPYGGQWTDGRLCGLGSNDCGGSLVAMLAAYEELSKRALPFRLVYSATAGEENCAPDGIEMALPHFGRIDFGIVGEPTSLRVAVAERGLMVLDCTAHGVTGHAAREEGVNAIYEALADIEWIRAHQFAKVNPCLGPVKMSVTMIEAGTQHNVVPAECRFVVDVRPNGEYSNEEILEEIRAGVRSDVQPRSMKHSSSAIPATHPMVRKALALGLETFGSPTTSNQTRCTFPTFKLGPGDSSRSHRPDEYILASEVEEAAKIYVKLLEDGYTLE